MKSQFFVKINRDVVVLPSLQVITQRFNTQYLASSYRVPDHYENCYCQFFFSLLLQITYVIATILPASFQRPIFIISNVYFWLFMVNYVLCVQTAVGKWSSFFNFEYFLFFFFLILRKFYPLLMFRVSSSSLVRVRTLLPLLLTSIHIFSCVALGN